MRTGLASQKVSDKRRTAIGLTRADLGTMITALRTQSGRAGSWEARRREQYPNGLAPWRYAAEQNEVDANDKSPKEYKGGCL